MSQLANLDLSVNLWTPPPNATPLASMAFAAPATSITITTNVERGYESAQVGYPVVRNQRVIPAALPRELLDWRDLAHVVISEGSRTLFSGRLTIPQYDGPAVTGFTAHGYYDLLQSAIHDGADVMRTSGEMVRLTIAGGGNRSWIELGNASHWSDPGLEFDLGELSGGTVAQIIEQVVRSGGTDGHQWDFQLWDGNDATSVVAWLLSRERPSIGAAEYRVPWDNRVRLSYDAREIVTHCRVRYTDETSGTTNNYTDWYPATTDHSIENRYGIPSRSVEIQGGTLSGTVANSVAAAYFGEFSRRRWAGTIERAGAGLELMSGGARPGRYVRADHSWLMVEGLPDEDGPLLIHGTTWQSEGDALQVQVGPGMTSQDALIRGLRERAKAFAENRSPLTGARWS